MPGGDGIPEHAKLLLTLPNGQPGNTVLARKRRTTSHLAGPWPAGTPAGANRRAGSDAAEPVSCGSTGSGPWRCGYVGAAVLRGRSRIRDGGLRVRGMRGLLRVAASQRKGTTRPVTRRCRCRGGI